MCVMSVRDSISKETRRQLDANKSNNHDCYCYVHYKSTYYVSYMRKRYALFIEGQDIIMCYIRTRYVSYNSTRCLRYKGQLQHACTIKRQEMCIIEAQSTEAV